MAENNLFNLIMGRINDNIASPLSTMLIYYNNAQKLKDKDNKTPDKVVHADANCQAAQYYDIPTILKLSYGREVWDLLRKNTWDKKSGTSFKDVWEDSKRDIEADNHGFMQGVLHPLSNCNDILDQNYLRNLNK